jgi:hypothetical protein
VLVVHDEQAVGLTLSDLLLEPGVTATVVRDADADTDAFLRRTGRPALTNRVSLEPLAEALAPLLSPKKSARP